MHFFDVLAQKQINIEKEANKFYLLMTEKKIPVYMTGKNVSMLNVIESLFRSLPLAGNAVTYTEYLDITDFENCESVEQFCMLLEKVLSLLEQTVTASYQTHFIDRGSLDNQHSQIRKVIDFDLEKLGFTVAFKTTKDFGELAYVYPAEPEIVLAIENCPSMSESIINYSRPSIKGNLDEKEKFLYPLIKSVEHIAQDKCFPYPKIAEQAEVIFNMFNLRHDNINGKKKNPILNNISKKDLEDIFDTGFSLALKLLILDKFQKYDEKINKLRKEMKKKR